MIVVAVGATGYAASDASSTRPQRKDSERSRVARSVVGLTRAYGVVVPGCGGCDPRRRHRHFTPLGPSMNVALAPTPPSARVGTWCVFLEGGLSEGDVTVVVSAVNTGGPYIRHFIAEEAQWVLGAPGCGPGTNKIEIQTTGELMEDGKMVAVPSAEIAFSFSVEAG
jgi:hypothetical protein